MENKQSILTLPVLGLGWVGWRADSHSTTTTLLILWAQPPWLSAYYFVPQTVHFYVPVFHSVLQCLTLSTQARLLSISSYEFRYSSSTGMFTRTCLKDTPVELSAPQRSASNLHSSFPDLKWLALGLTLLGGSDPCPEHILQPHWEFAPSHQWCTYERLATRPATS